MNDVMEVRWETVLQEQKDNKICLSVCNFKTRRERRATKGDKRKRPSKPTTM